MCAPGAPFEASGTRSPWTACRPERDRPTRAFPVQRRRELDRQHRHLHPDVCRARLGMEPHWRIHRVCVARQRCLLRARCLWAGPDVSAHRHWQRLSAFRSGPPHRNRCGDHQLADRLDCLQDTRPALHHRHDFTGHHPAVHGAEPHRRHGRSARPSGAPGALPPRDVRGVLLLGDARRLCGDAAGLCLRATEPVGPDDVRRT